MEFSQALEMLKNGKVMARTKWKNEFKIYMARNYTLDKSKFINELDILTEKFLKEHNSKTCDELYIAQNEGEGFTWCPTNEDVMSDDWEVWVYNPIPTPTPDPELDPIPAKRSK